MARRSPTTLLAFAAFVVIGGANVVAVRFSNAELAPFWGAAARFAVASWLFFALVLLRRSRLPRGRALVGALLYGLLNFAVFYACAYYALVSVPAGLAAVVLGVTPLVTFLLAVAQGLEAFRWRVVAGGLLALSGLALIFGRQLGSAVPVPALLALLGAALAAGQASIVVKRYPPVDPVSMNAIGTLVGAVVLFLLSLAAGERIGLPTRTATWLAFLYLATLGALGLFLLVLYVLKRWTASATAYGIGLFPVVATALGAWLAHEGVTASFLSGAVLVLVGVYVGALSKKVAPAPVAATAEPPVADR